MKCDICVNEGWFLTFNTERKVWEVQRCDECKKYKSDEFAGEIFIDYFEKLQKLEKYKELDKLLISKNIDIDEFKISYIVPCIKIEDKQQIVENAEIKIERKLDDED